MGNNQAWTDWERTVIATYNKGVLDEELLTTFMETYRDSDIDSGGKEGTLSKDGLEAEEIAIKIFGVPIPKRPELPEDYKTWTSEQEAENEAFQEAYGDAFNGIADRFGWH